MGGRYSDEEAQEILKRALERDLASSEGIAHAELVEAAMEVGLAPEAVDRAAAEMQLELSAKQVLDQRRRRKKTRFYRSFMTFVVVNSFIAAVDLLSGGSTWFYWPLLGWGLGIVLQAGSAILPPTEEAAERALHREMARQQRLQAKDEEKRRKARLRQSRKQVESAFEEAVEQGVSSLLNALSNRISGAGQKPPGQQNDFDNYVRRQRSPAANAPPFKPSVKARVEEAAEGRPAEHDIEEQRAKHRQR